MTMTTTTTTTKMMMIVMIMAMMVREMAMVMVFIFILMQMITRIRPGLAGFGLHLVDPGLVHFHGVRVDGKSLVVQDIFD